MTLPRNRLPGPARPLDVDLGPGLDAARRTNLDRGGAALLHDVSVARTASVLWDLLDAAEEPIQRLLAGLEAFRQVQPQRRLAPVLSRVWSVPGAADAALTAFAAGIPVRDDAEIAHWVFGPKLWFTTNGVRVAWRPLGPGRPARPVLEGVRPDEPARIAEAARALRECGLTPPEVRLGDLGRLGPGAVFVPDVLAEPLAVRRRSGGSGLRLAFLPDRARLALLSVVLMRHGHAAARRHPDEPALGVLGEQPLAGRRRPAG